MGTLTFPKFRPPILLPRPPRGAGGESGGSADGANATPPLRLSALPREVRAGGSARDFLARTLCVLLVLLFAYLLRAPQASGQGSAAEIVVGPGEAITRIGDAIAQASDGDRIRILPGTYREGTISVDRSVALIGEGFPVLDGEDTHPVIVVRADDVEIRGLLIRNAGVSHTRDNAAIRFEEVARCVAEGNRLENNFFGIYLAKTRDCRVTGNLLEASGTRESSSGNGIHLWNARNTRIERNRIVGHRDGIYLEFAEVATLNGNQSEGNLRYGLHFMFSSDTEYTGNVFRDNSAGVAIMYSRRVRIEGNRFEDNWGAAAYGLLLKEMTDSEIRGNTFRRNTVALYSEGSARNQIRGNVFVRNGWAVRVRSNSRENHFAENDFVDNAFDVSTDSRRNANTFAGNFWSRYDGYDLTGDGVGDLPFRPVRLFSLVVERTPAAMVLLRTFFVDLLDLAERVMPVLTPETLVDESPRMRPTASSPQRARRSREEREETTQDEWSGSGSFARFAPSLRSSR
jgi:nitrous oxidase accessory protein